MAPRQRKDRETIRTAVLTLRLTQEEMLRFKVAALGLRKKRSKIVRERVADLIGRATENADLRSKEPKLELAPKAPGKIFGKRHEKPSEEDPTEGGRAP